MSTSSANDFLDLIYRLNSKYDYKNIETETTKAITQWAKYNNWSELSTIFFAADLNKLSKNVAVMLLEEAYEYKDDIGTYNGFVDYCIDYYGDEDSFNGYRK